jgi:hypothetical protein
VVGWYDFVSKYLIVVVNPKLVAGHADQLLGRWEQAERRFVPISAAQALERVSHSPVFTAILSTALGHHN